MVESSYSFILTLYKEDGDRLGEAAVEPDWGPAYEDARLTALRRGRLSPDAFHSDGVVQPIWDTKSGRPHVAGVKVALENVAAGPDPDADGGVIVPITYFRKLAEAASAQLVARGVLKEGDTFQYGVLAHEKNGCGGPSDDGSVRIREAGDPLPVHASALDPYLARSMVCGPDTTDDFPVFFPASMLERIAALVRDAGPCETGGMLIGRLCRDADAGELFAEVTAQLPAEHVQADSASLTFTGETWAAARDAIRLRGGSETPLGWYHSHPAKEWCKDCPPEKRASCSLECFFSAADQQVHATLFPHAYSVALVVTDGQRGLRFDLYGWRRTRILQRGFHMLRADGGRGEASS